MNRIYEPLPWYISGPLIAFIMFLLLMVDKKFGVSANLRTICTMCGADKNCAFFKFDWKAQRWNLIVILGAVVGGFIGSHYLSNDVAVAINPVVVENLALLVLGGLFVGFGTRYAGGCTSGHAISGLSDLQIPSLIAVIGFFVGGIFMIHVLFPLIF